MPHNQKSQLSELEGRPQAQTESAGLVDRQVPQIERGAVLTTSSATVVSTTVGVPAALVGEQVPQAKREEHSIATGSSSTPVVLENTGLVSELIPNAREDCSVNSTTMDMTMESSATGNQHCTPSCQIEASASCMESSSQSRLNYSAGNQQGENLCPQITAIDLMSLQQDAVSLMPCLLHKYWMKEQVTMEELLSYINPHHHHYYSVIFGRARAYMLLIFGVYIQEVDPITHTYVLNIAAGLTYDGIMAEVQGMPKAGLLIVILSIIFTEGNRAKEEVIWQALSMMGVYAWKEHCLFGDPWKLIMEDFIREGYLEYRQVPGSDPACYEFLWGPRARAETSKMKILVHCAHFGGIDPMSFSALYEEALRDEHRGAHV
ncbi:melanoma-associated antigen 9-like [Perognathus longimembris pacificus]|uniref:melanoma-associated antigen 9-like n=1 Tax=Perognathus longimembris pacificus TaxID=214514 RepID=UPI00201904E7|nr:melanoma-associated antigen 9-like [Perognathus longimembris pacificus]